MPVICVTERNNWRVSTVIAKILSVFFLSTVKFMWAPGTALVSGFSFFETILITTLGGMTGITFFYFFGMWAVEKMEGIKRKSKFSRSGNKPKKVFTRKNRQIIKIKASFGLIGLVIVTPALLSIPIGCVVAAKFYRHNKLTYPLLLVSTFAWSLLLTTLVFFIKSNW